MKFVGLRERSRIANNAGADLFVSLHCNSDSDRDTYGSETFVYERQINNDALQTANRENNTVFLEKDYDKDYKDLISDSIISYISFRHHTKEQLEQSQFLAGNIQKNFSDSLQLQNRGVKQAKFIVLNDLNIPGVVVQLSFLTSVEDSYFLTSNANLRDLSAQISYAILDYKKTATSTQPDFTAENLPVEQKVEIQEVNEASVPVNQESNKTTYYVQILAMTKGIDLIPENFKGLNQISMTREGDIYKYRYGKSKFL